ncbi:MAG: hypothetical protein WCP21_01355 [Armatimonadota bacterium]
MTQREITSKQQARAALEGRQVDRLPVTPLHDYVYRMDHFIFVRE